MDENKTVQTTEAEASVPEAGRHKKGGMGIFKLKEWKPFYEVKAEDDITYQGYLSYRHLKAIAWFLIVVACYGSALALYDSAAGQANKHDTLIAILEFGKELSVPLLLFAAFATILNGRGNYKKVIMTNAGIAAALSALFFIVYYRFIVRGGTALLGSKDDFNNFVSEWLNKPEKPGFMSFNIFIDLTLCTLVFFFINYNPKKHFQGKLIYVFRGFTLIPIAYEIASICLKILASNHVITLPVQIFPFLTTKPPVSFLMFLFIARYFKSLEHRFIKHGKTHEDFEAYQQTNHMSFKFSRFLVIAIVIFAVIDVIAVIALAVLHMIANNSGTSEEELTSAMNIVTSWGFGDTARMLLIAPLLLMFSYTRTHKNKLIDLAVPLAGVALIVIVYVDKLFGAVCELLKKME